SSVASAPPAWCRRCTAIPVACAAPLGCGRRRPEAPPAATGWHGGRPPAQASACHQVEAENPARTTHRTVSRNDLPRARASHAVHFPIVFVLMAAGVDVLTLARGGD